MEYWECPICKRKVAVKMKECPHCRPVIPVIPEPVKPAIAVKPVTPAAVIKPAKKPRPVVKFEFIGLGCAIQAIGVILLFWFPFGTLLGLLLLVIGSRMARKWICSECKNPLASKSVTLCPACRVYYSPQGK